MKVRLHSNDVSAMEATDNTLRMLAGGDHRDRGEAVAVYYDLPVIVSQETSTNPQFCEFAILQQGYVREVVQ